MTACTFSGELGTYGMIGTALGGLIGLAFRYGTAPKNPEAPVVDDKIGAFFLVICLFGGMLIGMAVQQLVEGCN
jgi:hypothetical protein